MLYSRVSLVIYFILSSVYQSISLLLLLTLLFARKFSGNAEMNGSWSLLSGSLDTKTYA